MKQQDNRRPQPAPPTPDFDGQADHDPSEAVAVSILLLRPGTSPRLNGQDKAHIARLAETETPLPAILVDRSTMRVIDGMHRLMAASLNGWDTIDVLFLDESEDDMYLRAVRENVRHGLPLSLADRRAAVDRIVASHPHLSDRAISQLAGLAAKSVAAIRRRTTGDKPNSNARVGRDGRVRPLDSGAARRKAAELLRGRPDASIRDVARAVGISPSTVLDVRKRLVRGEPVVQRSDARGAFPTPGVAAEDAATREAESPPPSQGQRPSPTSAPRPETALNPAIAVQKLSRDPSLRNNDEGKGVLRLLHVNAVGSEKLPDVAAAVPSHCVTIVVELAQHYARMWQEFAQELGGRANVIDP